MIEIGCAPSISLLSTSDTSGLELPRIDYSEPGYRRTIDYFRTKGLPADGIMHGDFTSEVFRGDYLEYFDVIYSNGLIERFTNPEESVKYHTEPLKPGDILIIAIPNLLGLDYPILSLQAQDVLKIHNLDVMRRPGVSELFSREDLKELYRGYQF